MSSIAVSPMTRSRGISTRPARGLGARGVPEVCMPSSSLLPESRRTTRENDAVRRTAIVDLGSNSFRLVVFRYEVGGAWAVWDEIREPVRLSAGMGEEQVLRHGPVARALDTVRTFGLLRADRGRRRPGRRHERAALGGQRGRGGGRDPGGRAGGADP